MITWWEDVGEGVNSSGQRRSNNLEMEKMIPDCETRMGSLYAQAHLRARGKRPSMPTPGIGYGHCAIGEVNGVWVSRFMETVD